MTDLAGLLQPDGSVRVPPGLAGEVLRRLARDMVTEARQVGGQPSPACRRLLDALYEAAQHTEPEPRRDNETTAATSSTVELTADEAARVMGSSTQWVRRLAGNGQLRARRVGRNWLIDAASLDDYRHRRTAA